MRSLLSSFKRASINTVSFFKHLSPSFSVVLFPPDLLDLLAAPDGGGVQLGTGGGVQVVVGEREQQLLEEHPGKIFKAIVSFAIR